MESIKELRERNRAGSIDGAMLPDSQSDQVISSPDSREVVDSVRPGPGLQAASSKQQAIQETVPHNDIEEASSAKLQASSAKLIKK